MSWPAADSLPGTVCSLRMLACMQHILYQSPRDWAGNTLQPQTVAWQQLASPCNFKKAGTFAAPLQAVALAQPSLRTQMMTSGTAYRHPP